jgi:hypothetical protein
MLFVLLLLEVARDRYDKDFLHSAVASTIYRPPVQMTFREKLPFRETPNNPDISQPEDIMIIFTLAKKYS